MNKTVSIKIKKSISQSTEIYFYINTVEDEQSTHFVESQPAVISSDDEPYTDAEDFSPFEESTSSPVTSSEVPATFVPEEGCSIITPSESDSIPMDIGVLLKKTVP